MAKRKKRREKKEFKYVAELLGIVFILISILGIGKYGVVGRMLSSFSLFLVGSMYLVFLVVIFILGSYMIIKREKPNFLSTKLIGIYIATIGLLVLMHKEFVVQNDGNSMNIFKETINQLVAGFNFINSTGYVKDAFAVGGGLIGAIFAIIFDALFSLAGMEIVAWVMIIAGILLFTGFSIADLIFEKYSEMKENNAIKKEKKKLLKKEKELEAKEKKSLNSVIISDGNDTNIEPPKKVINSISEITDASKNVSDKLQEAPIQSAFHDNVSASYELPPLDILSKPGRKNKGADNDAIEKNIINLEKVLKDFNIIGKVVEVHVGPTVSQYELEIQSGTKLNRLLNINKEIALALAKKDVRIEAPIPGKKTVGIEFANDKANSVSFYETMADRVMSTEKVKENKLVAPLGKSIMGNVETCEINKMPHLLIAGTTGSGKSVCVNGIICSILMRARPDEVKLAMVDPKVVELSVYNGIPHLMCPVVSDPKKASVLLQKMVGEMERRYQVFANTKTKNIESYNDYISKHPSEGEKMPYVVIIIDELADLMMVAAKEVESSILRITQKARAAGMHLIVATQRPSTEVITGLIKAHIPSRIAFAVGSGIDSRTILDQTGAEKLLGKGDMLFLPIGANSPTRIQGSFINDDEIKKIIDFVSKQSETNYDEALMNLETSSSSDSSSSDNLSSSEGASGDDKDALYDEVVKFVVETGKASASLIQRKFSVGYNRAARIIDQLEENGIIGPQNGSKPREVLVTLSDTSNVE